jgi:hypothetical protein
MQTWTQVQTESIITQLIFEHALRIRVKADTSIGLAPDRNQTSPAAAIISPSTTQEDLTSQPQADILVNIGKIDPEVAASVSGDDTPSDETLGTSSTSVNSDASKKVLETLEAPLEPESSTSSPSHASNLVGKINNLVSTDLGNIVDASNPLLLFLYVPLEISLCIVFLYVVLGWRFVHENSFRMFCITHLFC